MSNGQPHMWARQKGVEAVAECYGIRLGQPVWSTIVDDDGNELMERKQCEWEGFVGATAQWERYSHVFPEKKGKGKRKRETFNVRHAVALGMDSAPVFYGDVVLASWGDIAVLRFAIRCD